MDIIIQIERVEQQEQLFGILNIKKSWLYVALIVDKRRRSSNSHLVEPNG